MSEVKIRRMNKTVVNFPKFKCVDLRSDANAGNYAAAEYSSNFDMSDGSLRLGIGSAYFSTQALPEKCIKLYFYKRADPLTGEPDERIMYYSVSGKIYQRLAYSGTFAAVSGLNFTAVPVGVNYNYNGEDVMIFASSGGTYIYNGTSVTSVPDAPPITSACVHYERLFATVDGGKTLWFSDDFDPANWNVSLTEAGFIDLGGFRGELLKVVSFLDYVYVFRSYGITRISAYGDQRAFSVSDLFLSNGKIVGSSITFCGDRILFMASDGFYSFNGLTATRILTGLDGAVDYSSGTVKGVFLNGKVYFNVLVRKNNSQVKCMLVYNTVNGTYYFSEGISVADFELFDGRIFCELCHVSASGLMLFKITNEGTYMATPLTKVWQSKLSDFGVKKQGKILDSISLFTNAALTLKADNGSESEEFTISPSTRRQYVRPMLRGENFRVKITCSEGNVKVSGLSLTFAYYNE
ncbi:MAG: hypothetical protein IJS67_03320 [Clostridia bacterium]|nr:hypothetical protein [Clostridia bacterium]